MYTATYSPDDNKLRLYAAARLDADTYAKVKAAGFRWAPKQDLFVAPAWTPEREDLLLELAGEIGDEDTSLVERAAERAERFEGYHERRGEEAEWARQAVAAIADNIPLGQPILVGHHSERRARKDAERIEAGMRRAVDLWRTAQYWEDRARGAIRHARYKERPDVRARRIKGLEAEQRKVQRTKEQAEKSRRLWRILPDDGASVGPREGLATFAERALWVAGNTNTAPWGVYSDLREGKITADEARARTLAAAEGIIQRCDRWLAHLANRLTYERAMLADAGGTVADRVTPEVGGACRCWASPRGGWSYIRKVNRVSVTVDDNWGNGGANFTRTIPFDKLSGIMSAADVERARGEGRLTEDATGRGFFLADTEPKPVEMVKRAGAAGFGEYPADGPNRPYFDELAERLRQGVTVAVAPQLFPTPPDLAARMVALADIQPGDRVLEPSAGTGNLLAAIGERWESPNYRERGALVAVEINPALAEALRARYPRAEVVCGDFLAFEGGPFDCIVMNPPFENGADIRHIVKARSLLAPGGRLVALCANGPRQARDLSATAETWEELAAGTFEGTGVRAVLATFTGEG